MNSALSQKQKRNFELQSILLIYHCNTQDENDKYIEAAKAEKAGDLIRINQAVPLTRKAASELFRLSAAEDEAAMLFSSLVPDNLLYMRDTPGNRRLIWYTPGAMQSMIFDGRIIQTKVVRAYVPSLVWMILNDNLYLFAIEHSGTVKLDTKLCNAPFLNMFDSGQVCMGNAKFKNKMSGDVRQIISNYMGGFWASEFTEHLNDSSPIKGNLISYYKSKAAAKHFDYNLLIENKKTIKDLITYERD